MGHCCAAERSSAGSNSSGGLWFDPLTLQLKAQQQFLFTSIGERPGTTECVSTRPRETQLARKKEFSSAYNKQLQFISWWDLGSDCEQRSSSETQKNADERRKKENRRGGSHEVEEVKKVAVRNWAGQTDCKCQLQFNNTTEREEGEKKRREQQVKWKEEKRSWWRIDGGESGSIKQRRE